MAQTNSLDLERSSTQYASIADASQTGLDLTGDLTFEAWVNFESITGGQLRPFIGKRNSTGNQRSYLWYLSGTNSFQLQTSNDGSSFGDVSVTWAPVAGVWYHIAVTKSGTTVKFYVNGRQQGSDQSLGSSTIFNGTAPFEVGNFTDSGGDTYDGLIKDVRVFNDVRTQSEIAADAHTQNVSDANLQGEWNFNNSYADTSGNGNTLTGQNSPTFPTTVPWTAPANIDGSYLETGVQGYWTFDESSGNAADSTANNNTLTNRNSTAYAPAKIENGADMEASSDNGFSITDASQTGLDFSNDMTIALWMKFESVSPPAGYFAMFIKRIGAGNQRSYSLYGGVTTLNFDWSSTGANGTDTSVSWTPSTGTWYHVVMSKKDAVITYFVNGVQLGATQTGAFSSIFNSNSDVQVGWWSENADADMDGFFDEMGVWNVALDYGGVLDLYNNNVGISWAADTQTTGPMQHLMQISGGLM